MFELKQLKERIAGKHVLIDTCVLINMMEADNGAESYINLLEFLRSAGCVLVINEVVAFEFMRKARGKSELLSLESNLKVLIDYQLPVLSENISQASRLSFLYSQERSQFSKQISFIDCINASHLLKRDIILITEDLNDYPVSLFNCFWAWPIEIRTQKLTSVRAVGFFELDNEKLRNELQKFDK